MGYYKKRPTDLFRNPKGFEPGTPTPPVTKAMDYLAITEGTMLEILTRTNGRVISAIDSGTTHVFRYKSQYILSRIQQIERLAISAGGQGRTEMIDAVKAGGSMPDSFYEGGSRSSMDEAIEDE